MTLPRRKLGTSDLDIAPVGFGAWAISGSGWRFAWGPQDDDASVAAIRAAVEAGVNWIDTAAVYGLGHSEEVVGRALRELPEADRPLVFTKCGLVWDDDRPELAPWRVMEPAGVRRELEGSLRRLGVDAVDLYQVHWPPTGARLFEGPSPGVAATPLEEYWQVMADLRDEGKVRAIGLSNHDVDQLDRAEAIAHVDALQPPFSLVVRDPAPELAWCHDHGAGAIVYSPLQSGLLTGRFSAERVASLPQDDWRRTAPDFTTGLPPILALVDRLRPIAERHGVPVASVAVAWTLAWPGVSGAIVGARGPDQIAGWAPAATLTLTDDDLAEIDAALVATGAGSGPTHP